MKLFKTIFLLSACVFFFAGNAMAVPLTGALQDAINERTAGGSSSIDVTSEMIDDSLDSHWMITASGQSAATLLFEFAGYAENTSFGVYDINNSNIKLEIFSGPNSNPGNPSDGAYKTLSQFNHSFSIDNFSTSVTFTTDTFGYYIFVGDTGKTYYSDTMLNNDNYDHMLAYVGENDNFSVFNNGSYKTWTPHEFILAFEDIEYGGDQDFTDFVVMVESVRPAPVPEPATMLLLGLGLVGLAGVARKRMA